MSDNENDDVFYADSDARAADSAITGRDVSPTLRVHCDFDAHGSGLVLLTRRSEAADHEIDVLCCTSHDWTKLGILRSRVDAFHHHG